MKNTNSVQLLKESKKCRNLDIQTIRGVCEWVWKWIEKVCKWVRTAETLYKLIERIKSWHILEYAHHLCQFLHHALTCLHPF